MGIIVTFFFYYGIVEPNERQQQLSIVQETARISNILVEELMSEIADADTVTPLQNKPRRNTDPQTAEADFIRSFPFGKMF